MLRLRLCARRMAALRGSGFFEEKPNGKSKGYVLVDFDSAKAAYLCKQSLDGYQLLLLEALLCIFS